MEERLSAQNATRRELQKAKVAQAQAEALAKMNLESIRYESKGKGKLRRTSSNLPLSEQWGVLRGPYLRPSRL